MTYEKVIDTRTPQPAANDGDDRTRHRLRCRGTDSHKDTIGELTRRPPDMPTIRPRGELTYRGRSVCLSERNAQLVSVFVYHFGSELTDLELLDRVWPEGATRRTLRLHLRRLDRRLARVGLAIVDTGYRSHALLPVENL